MIEPAHALQRLSGVLRASGSLDQTLRGVVDCAAELVAAPRVSIRLLDPEHRALIAICRAGEPLHHNPAVTYELGEGLLGWIAMHGKPLRSGDAMADERFVKRPDLIAPFGSFLGVPFITSGAAVSVVGVLSAVATERDAFTAEHEGLLVRIADVAAPYVEAARLRRLQQLKQG